MGDGPYVIVDPILREASKWLESIRDRRLAAAAKLLFEAGAVVVAMRALRDRMRALLSPLAGFNPQDWGPERRAAWIADLRKFVEEAPIFGIVTEHALTLRELRTSSKEIEHLRDGLVYLAGNVTHGYEQVLAFRSGPAPMGESDAELRHRLSGCVHQDLGYYERKGRDEEGDASFQWRPGSPDLLINLYLPALLWLVRHADDSHPEQVEALRTLARCLLVTRSKRGDQKLEDVVGEVEVAFGTFKGKLFNKYPRLPSPTWTEASPGSHPPSP